MKSKIVNVLTIHSKGVDPFETLAWWNISKIKIKDIDYILIHQGKGKVTDAYKLNRTKDGIYRMVSDYNGQKAKNPYVEVVFPDGSKRVSFVDFSDFMTLSEFNYEAIELPKTKQGQAQPLQILQLDLATMKIVEAPKKEKKAPKKEKKVETAETAS
jgi:hypothetical protein